MAGDRTAHGRDARRGRPPLTVFIDTNVFLYAGGREHPLREVCRRLLDAVQRGEVMATTSVEVVQEIMHVSMRVFGARRAAAVQAARGALQLCAPVLALDLHDASRAIELVEQIDGLSPRDALLTTYGHPGESFAVAYHGTTLERLEAELRQFLP